MPCSTCQLYQRMAVWRAEQIRSRHLRRASSSVLPLARSSTMSSISGCMRWMSTSRQSRVGCATLWGGSAPLRPGRRVVEVELEVGGLRRRGSDRGLSSRGGAQLSFGRCRRGSGRHGFEFLLWSESLWWRSSNRVRPSRGWLQLGFGSPMVGGGSRGLRHARPPRLGRNGRRCSRARRQLRLGALGLLLRPGRAGAILSGGAARPWGSDRGWRLCVGRRREFQASFFRFQASFFRDAEGFGQSSSDGFPRRWSLRPGRVCRRCVRTPRRRRGGEAHASPLRVPVPLGIPAGSLHGGPRRRGSFSMAGTALLGIGWFERGSRALAPRRVRLLGRRGGWSAGQRASHTFGHTCGSAALPFPIVHVVTVILLVDRGGRPRPRVAHPHQWD